MRDDFTSCLVATTLGSSNAVPSAGASAFSTSDAVAVVAFLTVGVIVFVVAHASLRRTPLFGGVARTIVAACTAAMSLIGLTRTPPWPGESPTGGSGRVASPEVEGILLGYSALGLTLILLLLLLLILRMARRITGWWSGLRGAGGRATQIKSNRRKPRARNGTCGRARTDRLARINRAPDDRLP